MDVKSSYDRTGDCYIALFVISILYERRGLNRPGRNVDNFLHHGPH